MYTAGSVLEVKPAAASVIDDRSSIECLPDGSSIVSAELHVIYLACSWACCDKRTMMRVL